MGVFIETCNAFSGEPSTEREDQVIIRKAPFDITMRYGYLPLMGIDACHFGFDKVDSLIQQGLAQIE